MSASAGEKYPLPRNPPLPYPPWSIDPDTNQQTAPLSKTDYRKKTKGSQQRRTAASLLLESSGVQWPLPSFCFFSCSFLWNSISPGRSSESSAPGRNEGSGISGLRGDRKMLIFVASRRRERGVWHTPAVIGLAQGSAAAGDVERADRGDGKGSQGTWSWCWAGDGLGEKRHRGKYPEQLYV